MNGWLSLSRQWFMLRRRTGTNRTDGTNSRSGFLAEDGWAGGIGLNHGAGREEGSAVFVEVARHEDRMARFPHEVGHAFDGFSAQRFVNVLGHVRRDFRESLTNVLDQFWRWFRVVVSWVYFCLFHNGFWSHCDIGGRTKTVLPPKKVKKEKRADLLTKCTKNTKI